MHGFEKDWGVVAVTVQRSINQFRIPRRVHGHWEMSELHIPYDTYQKLKEFRPDVIISGQLGARTIFAALYRKFNRKVKLILSATLSNYSEEKRSWVRRVLRKWTIRNIDGAFVNGKSGEEYLRKLGYDGPLYYVPYSIDAEIFKNEVYFPQEPVRLLSAGALIPRKGTVLFTENLIRWCVNHPQKQIIFRVIGNGIEWAKLNKLVLPPNLTLELQPKVAQLELAKSYKASDIFVFPTLEDEWGVTVNEAMNAGLPVLGSIYGQAVTELITEGQNGWLYDAKNEESVYGALDRALHCSVDELKSMSTSALEVIANISPEKIADRVINAVIRICNIEATEMDDPLVQCTE